MKTNGVILILLLSAALRAETAENFQRYQLIIDKHPFGEEPPEADTVQIPLDQSFAKTLRLSMIYEGPGGSVLVGVVDTDTKKDYVLRIGETEDGLELVEADLEAAEALLRKGNEVVLLKLESGEIEPLSKSQQAARKSSYEDRRRERMASQPAAEPQQPRLTGEALRQHLEEVQMDAIRNGLPPLPLPLTPEMDNQLVAEGVLDPQ